MLVIKTCNYWRFRLDSLLLGGCPILCRIFSDIPGLHPRVTSHHPHPSEDNQKCLQTLPDIPGRQNYPWLVTTEIQQLDGKMKVC